MKKSNKKSVYQEGGMIDKSLMDPTIDELSKVVEARLNTGEAVEQVLYSFLQEGVPQEQLVLAFETVGYDSTTFGNLLQNVEQMVMQQQEAQQQAQQQAQAAQVTPEQQLAEQMQRFTPEYPVMQFGGARPLYLPPIPERGNLLGASLYAADAFENLFSKEDRDGDGVRDGAFQDMSAKRARYKNKQLQNRTYDVDFKGVDPSNYVVTWQDLAEGNVRTKGQFEDDVKKYSQLDFDPVSNRYFGNIASSELDRSMLGKDQIKNLEKSISLGDFIDNIDALKSTDTGEDDLAFIRSGMNYAPGTGLGYRPGQYTIMNAEGKPEVVYTGKDEAYSYNESGLSPAELRRRRAGQRDIMLGMRNGGSLPQAQNGLAEFTAQVPVYNAAGECIMNCRNLRVDPKFDYEIGANLTAGMLDNKPTGSGKITSGFSFNPNRGLGGIDGYIGGNIGGRATVSDNDEVSIDPFANLASRVGYAGRLPRRRSGLFGAKGAPYGIGAFYNKSLMGNEGDVVGGYGRLGNFNVTGGYNTTTNTPQFTVGVGIPIKKSGGQSLPKAQRGNGNNRLKTFVNPRGSKVKTMIDPMFNVGMKSIYSPQTGSMPGLGFDIKGPLFSQRFIKGRDQELRGTGNVGVNYYNTDHLGGFAGPVLQTSGLRGGYDLDYTRFPSARNMKNMAYDVSLDTGLNYGMGEDTDFLAPQDRTSGVGFDASVYGGLRNRKTGASGGLYGSYGSKYSFEPGLRVGAKGQLPVGDRFTINPNIGYDAQSDAMRYGLSLGMKLKQGGSLPKAQIGDEFLDLSGLADIGMEPFEEQEALSPFDLQNRLTSEQMAAKQAQVAPVGVLGSQISPDFTSGISQIAQKGVKSDTLDLSNLEDIGMEEETPEVDLVTAGSPSVKRKRNLSNLVDQAETFIKDDPAMRAYGATSNALVMGANLANEYFKERKFQDAKNQRRGATMADKAFATVEDPSNVRGTFDVNTGLMEPDNLVDYYAMAKKGGEFKPHMMYDPETGKGYKAQKHEDHLRMDRMGYTHDKLSQQGGEVEVDNDTLAALIAAGADIEML